MGDATLIAFMLFLFLLGELYMGLECLEIAALLLCGGKIDEAA